MLTGKAVARAVRGFMLVDLALQSLLVEQMFQAQCEFSEECTEYSELLQSVLALYDNLTSEHYNSSSESIESNESLTEISTMMSDLKEQLQRSRTSSLWITFCEMMAILRRFLKSERTGNWDLHLQTTQEMLPYFAASGHNLYTKSAYIYLSNMQNLETEHPDVYKYFQDGHNVLQRCDRYWAGLSTDLAIEQVLMKNIKSCGGLTRGRGLNEAQWLLSMPACAEYNSAMQNVTGVITRSDDQHKEMLKERMARDFKDTKTIIDFLKERNPFAEDLYLRSIVTGEVADDTANADKALEIGQKILKKMVDQPVTEFSFKRSEQVITVRTKPNSKSGFYHDHIDVDPQLMFQRLMTAANGLFENTSDVFKHELSSFPSSLFDNNGLPRESCKSPLADAIWSLGTCEADNTLDENMQHVIDVGSLLQRISWRSESTFKDICQVYVTHINARYTNFVIVFDSYPDYPVTKDITHMRRSKGIVSPKVNFEENMPFKSKKEAFLGNPVNKQKFINMLSSKLYESGVRCLKAVDDADLLIAQSTVNFSKEQKTAVIGEDTDLLVLLCHHADPNQYPIIFKSDKQVERKIKIWDISKTIKSLGEDLCNLLPFIHSLTGCDTTSRLFGIGKNIGFKKCKENAYFMEQGKTFIHSSSSKDDVIKAGAE